MGLKSVLAKINKARDDYIAERERRAERELERLGTKTAREKERARLAKERANAREQAERAKAAAIRAEAARRKAEKELKGEGILGQLMRELSDSSKPKRKSRSKR